MDSQPPATRDPSVLRVTLETPLGPMVAGATASAVCLLEFLERAPREGRTPTGPPGAARLLARLRRELGEYFAGRRRAFDLPLAPRGSAFQRRVWDALCRIPYGRTCSYGELARAVGEPGAARAVGQANGRNPIAIVIPCHRVIAADGGPGGYGAGLPRKLRLLQTEGIILAPATR